MKLRDEGELREQLSGRWKSNPQTCILLRRWGRKAQTAVGWPNSLGRSLDSHYIWNLETIGTIKGRDKKWDRKEFIKTLYLEFPVIQHTLQKHIQMCNNPEHTTWAKKGGNSSENYWLSFLARTRKASQEFVCPKRKKYRIL